MAAILAPTSLVLVTILTSPRDLEIARLLGWYRIPLRTAPKVIAVDYLAFYQTAAFGDLKWRIEYIARVRGHELVSRAELIRDEAGHPRAHEEYFKIQLGSLERLPKPILASDWKRLTFLYTTGEYLLKASTLNDLVIHTDERKLLWQALRERVSLGQGYQVEADAPALELDAEMLLSLLGIKELEGNYKPDQPDE